MKNKKIILWLMGIICIIGCIAFGVVALLSGIKEDQLKTQEKMKEINIQYETLMTNAEAFNSKKAEYDELMDNTYYVTVSKNEKKIRTVLEEYDAIITEIIKNGKSLEQNCNNYFQDKEIMHKCNSYKISYESAMTIFTSDVARYNTLVKDYNEWTKENKGYRQITTFVSKNIE